MCAPRLRERHFVGRSLLIDQWLLPPPSFPAGCFWSFHPLLWHRGGVMKSGPSVRARQQGRLPYSEGWSRWPARACALSKGLPPPPTDVDRDRCNLQLFLKKETSKTEHPPPPQILIYYRIFLNYINIVKLKNYSLVTESQPLLAFSCVPFQTRVLRIHSAVVILMVSVASGSRQAWLPVLVQ